MFNKQKTISVVILCLFYFFTSVLIAQTVRNIYTLQGTLVGDSYDSGEMHYTWRIYYDSQYVQIYPNATQLKLWGEQYSASNRYNCHGYAWHMVEDNSINDPVWIGYNSEGQTYKYWNDESYSEVDVQYATIVDYSGDHSATTTGQANIYISKWRFYPLMRHHKDYHPGYGTQSKFLRKNPATPSDFATVQAAINDAVSGQIVHVDAEVPDLTANVSIPSGVTLKIHDGATINLNGYSIISAGGTINKSSSD